MIHHMEKKIYTEQFPLECNVPSIGNMLGFRVLRFVPLLPLVVVLFNYNKNREVKHSRIPNVNNAFLCPLIIDMKY